jgi:hypothetical protein
MSEKAVPTTNCCRGNSTVCDEHVKASFILSPTDLHMACFPKKYAIFLYTFRFVWLTHFDPVRTRRVLRLWIDEAACKYGRYGASAVAGNHLLMPFPLEGSADGVT